jgi:beta-1,4-mannosyl-glycoprotein beta-1,4-N-acetylglucosaminyltransferase
MITNPRIAAVALVAGVAITLYLLGGFYGRQRQEASVSAGNAAHLTTALSGSERDMVSKELRTLREQLGAQADDHSQKLQALHQKIDASKRDVLLALHPAPTPQPSMPYSPHMIKVSASDTFEDLDNSPDDSWKAPRMFEAFLFHNEIELLEVRIGELYDVVEKFVVVETLVTFPGVKKTPFFEKLRLQLPPKFLAKVAHFQCEDLPGSHSWAREASARICAKRAAIAAGARRYDLLHFSDADEIARASSFARILGRTRDIMINNDKAKGLELLDAIFPIGIGMQYFAHNFLRVLLPVGMAWTTDLFFIANATTYKAARRGLKRRSDVREWGWHCSWCFPTVAGFEEKFRAYSHTETVDERNFSPENVWNCTCGEGNIFKYKGPQERTNQIIVSSGGLMPPKYLRERVHEPRFQFLFPDNVSCRIPLS